MPDSRKGLNLCSIFPLLEEESPDDFSLVGEDSNDELVRAEVLRRATDKEIWKLQWDMASTAIGLAIARSASRSIGKRLEGSGSGKRLYYKNFRASSLEALFEFPFVWWRTKR